MNKLLVLLFLFFTLTGFSQVKITGRVVDMNNKPLEGASVYLNNTTIGVYSNEKGEFEFKVEEGTYELIVSYLGYKTIQYSLITQNVTKPFVFKLEDDDNLLNEVVLRKTVYDDTWKFYLEEFKNNFLGFTFLAEQCEILNPKTLHFEFDTKTEILTAFAKEPLKIKHNGLGYLISFDLVNFALSSNQINYFGYTKYENLKGSKRKQRIWNKNRLKAFHGSKMHFVKTLLNGSTKEEGFTIKRFRRELNPARPSEKTIEQARQLVKLAGVSTVDFSKEIIKATNPTDSAILVLRDASLPKFVNYIDKDESPATEFIEKKSNKTFLTFNDYISVTYTKEPEEDNFVMGLFGKKRKTLDMQTSSVVILKNPVEIKNTGEIVNPLYIFSEGYWAFEQFADALPLNYVPDKK